MTEGEAANARTIVRRVVHLGGYHPITPDDIHRRAAADLDRFCRVWTLSGQASTHVTEQTATRWQVRVSGRDWSSAIDYRFFRWDDVIRQERARSWATRLPLGLFSLADFLLSGASVGYVRTSWRYTLFFLYPLFVIVAFAMSGWLLGGLISDSGVTRILVAPIIFVGMLPLVGNRLYLDHLLDDWIHARRLVRATPSVINERLDGLATALLAESGELLVVGHSLGAVMGVHLIDKLIARGFDQPIRFATVGSSILKIGLHPGARTLQQAADRLARARNLLWVDFQALNDVMNFYKCEPVSTLGLDAPPALVRIVRFRSGILPERYRRLERNFFRLHNQFVHANDLRARYDFPMMTLGPFPLEALAASEDGPLSLLDVHGGLTEAGAAALFLNPAAQEPDAT